jgi:hypothetical protein
MTENPIELSVIVTMLGGPNFLDGYLARMVPQTEGRSVELIVPYDSTAGDLRPVIQKYPQVQYIDMGVVQTKAPPGTRTASHEIYDVRSAWGLRAARGDIIAVTQDCCVPAPDWIAQTLEAHRTLPHAAIGGAVEHGGQGGLNWAIYFLDYARFMLPVTEGPADYLTDANVAYKREALEPLRPLWEERYKEVTINWELLRRGEVMWMKPEMVVHQDRGPLTFADLLAERYYWGLLFAGIRVSEVSLWRRLFYIVMGLGVPIVLLGRPAKKVFAAGRNRLQFLKFLPQTLAMVTLWSLGEYVGYITGKEASLN